jgi:hypothetical protein
LPAVGTAGGGPVAAGRKDERGLATEIVLLFAAPAVWFIVRSTFGEGYFDLLGVPPELGLSPPVSTSTLISASVAAFATFVAAGKVASMTFAERRPLPYLLLRSAQIAFLTAVSGMALFLFALRWKWWFGAAGVGGGVFVAWLWLRPWFARHEGDNYARALDRLRAPKEKSLTTADLEPSDWSPEPLARFARLVGRSVAIALVAVVVAGCVGYWCGWMAAGNGPSWVKVERSDLAVAQPDAAWVLLSREPERLWVAPMRNSEIVGPALAIEPTGARLSRMPPTMIRVQRGLW